MKVCCSSSQNGHKIVCGESHSSIRALAAGRLSPCGGFEIAKTALSADGHASCERSRRPKWHSSSPSRRRFPAGLTGPFLVVHCNLRSASRSCACGGAARHGVGTFPLSPGAVPGRSATLLRDRPPWSRRSSFTPHPRASSTWKTVIPAAASVRDTHAVANDSQSPPRPRSPTSVDPDAP